MAEDCGERETPGGLLTIKVSQNELAQMLGVSRGIVCRQLAVWRQAGDRSRPWSHLVHDTTFFDSIVAGG